jgi:hypothetical protein
MNRYSLRYHSRTLASLAGRKAQQVSPLKQWVFDFTKEKLRVALSDSVKNAGGINLHTGLNMIADIEADSVESARATSKNIIETLLNFITLTTLTYCDSARQIGLIKIGDVEPYPFEQYAYPFDEQELFGSLNIIDELLFRVVLEAFDKSSHQGRTMRSLAWFRKGTGEDNGPDKFTSYWIGMEVLRHILRRKAQTRMRNPGKWAGIEVIFKEKLGYGNFPRILTARNELFHGARELSDGFMQEISSYLEPTRRALVFCIGDVLGLQDDITSRIANTIPRGIPKGPWVVIRGELTNLPVAFKDLAQNYPSFGGELEDVRFSISHNGDLNMEFGTRHPFSCPKGTKLDRISQELWGDREAGFRSGNISEVTPPQSNPDQ